MSYKLSNYNKKTPAKWQVVGDLALVLIPVIIGIIDNAPLTAELQGNLIFWLSSLMAIVKILTQFFGHNEK